ncbi:uncharacterized protein LOC135210965 [Macrobrachium nipponense]|uniref:uncharacterized protein LOC135210965 n=1 Tax=Macrobrachium nipponense TaxID=159736 RepID=UPI0030C811C1
MAALLLPPGNLNFRLPGAALKCYECSDSCNIIACDGSCVNIITRKNDEVVAHQSHCWPEKEEKKCVTSDIKGVITENCYCNTDGCNAGSITSLFGLLLLVPLIIHCCSFFWLV